ncbi:MAG: cytochrome P450 [Hyphomicrobiaceae bacterium]|nr:cytochrome P450 [Hyphomicrobiaceae bacterium]
MATGKVSDLGTLITRGPVEFEAARARETAQSFDLKALTTDFYENPYPYFHALRTHDPIRQLGANSYFITRYADLMAVYKDAKVFSSDKKSEFLPKFGDGLLYQHHTTSLIFNDPPLHTRVRRIIAGALNPRAVMDLEAPMIAMVDGLLDRMAERRHGDIIEDLAAAVPIEVIGNLLAIPHDARDPLRAWSLDILGALEPQLTPEMLGRGEIAVRDFLEYLRILVGERRKKPGNPERDVLTRLILGERDGETLSEVELLQNCIFILNAGHETTTNLIGNALYALLEWPDEKARLLADPKLIQSAVEEFLRFESPVQLGNRITTERTVIGGVEMQEGTFVTLGIAAANRDPAAFTDPDRLDLGRTNNKHLAFASGVHVCVGLTIARMEGRVAIQRFLTRFPKYRLSGPVIRGNRARFRGYLSIPVALG